MQPLTDTQPSTVSRWIASLRSTATLLGPSARFLTTTAAHTYAYSVAANLVLAFYPFVLLLLWLAHHALQARAVLVVYQLVRVYLPTGQALFATDLYALSHARGAQVFSFFMLAITSSGVFLPLEVALNEIWGFRQNRGYLANQLVSLGLVGACGGLLYTAVQLAFMVHPSLWGRVLDSQTWTWDQAVVVNLFSWPALIVCYFLVYWLLPHGKVPAAQVFPAAIYTGTLTEIFKVVFRLVLPLLDFPAVYGRLTLAVTLLIWGYCLALLLLFGASLSQRGVVRLPRFRRRSGEGAGA